jgi:hypothetical protein
VADQERLFGSDRTSAFIGQACFDGSGNGPVPADAHATGTGGINPNDPVSTSGIDERRAAGTDDLDRDPEPFSSISAQDPFEVYGDLRPGASIAADNAKDLSIGCAQTGLRRSDFS